MAFELHMMLSKMMPARIRGASRRTCWLILLVLVRPAAADEFDAVRSRIRREIASTNAPSIAVAVARNGRIIWEEGFGWADREKRFPATEHTMYSLASISKPITATGLMLLVQAGKIRLDRPVNDYLGAAKVRARVGDAAQATVRRVANHSSGLPLHYQFFYADEPFRPPPMDETIRRYANLVTMPGEKYEYSNLGYGILDYVMARVSGKAYPDFMRDEVFARLGLKNMSVNTGSGFGKSEAIRYGSDGAPIPFYDFDHRGGSAVYASVHDLVRFALFHLKARVPGQARILSDESITEMQKPTMVTGPQAGYGIGWAVSDTPAGYRVVSHTGGMGGVSTSLRLVPAGKLAVAVLCNASSSLPHAIADEIFRIMLPKWKDGRRPPAPGAKPGEFQPPPDLAGGWKGKLHTYKDEIPLRLQIRESGEMVGQLAGQPESTFANTRSADGVISGRVKGDIGAEDANRRPYLLHFTLKLRGGVLNGPATAVSLPGRRVGNALTQWVELRREIE